MPPKKTSGVGNKRKHSSGQIGNGSSFARNRAAATNNDDTVSEDSNENDDSNSIDTDVKFGSRPAIVGKKSHRPAPKARWRFVAGSDLTPAVLGRPDPSKFFLLRESRDNPAEKDCREYPKWREFDWNNKKHIAALNRNRSQIVTRTNAGNLGNMTSMTSSANLITNKTPHARNQARQRRRHDMAPSEEDSESEPDNKPPKKRVRLMFTEDFVEQDTSSTAPLQTNRPSSPQRDSPASSIHRPALSDMTVDYHGISLLIKAVEYVERTESTGE